mgnify:CR=1 FL=1
MVVHSVCVFVFVFLFQAEDGIRDRVRSRGLGDVYKRQGEGGRGDDGEVGAEPAPERPRRRGQRVRFTQPGGCLLYTSDAADERSSGDLGGRRIIKKKKRG